MGVEKEVKETEDAAREAIEVNWNDGDRESLDLN